jgi:hypothetical protein
MLSGTASNGAMRSSSPAKTPSFTQRPCSSSKASMNRSCTSKSHRCFTPSRA